MLNQDHDIKILHDLIETTIDSAEGYSEAAREAVAPYRDSFKRRAGEHNQVAQVLQRRLQMLGADPEESGSAVVAGQRMFVNLRRTFSAGEQAIVNEVERGEDYLRTRFEDALHDQHLSLPTRAVIADAYAAVRSGYQQMQVLRQHAHRSD